MSEQTAKTVAERVYDVLHELVATENAGYGLWLVDEESLRQAVATLTAQGLLAGASAPASPGHHVMVTVDPARNMGSASITRAMVPLYAPMGLLLAGDTEAVVREEYNLTEGELRLVAALTEDVRGFLAEREANED